MIVSFIANKYMKCLYLYYQDSLDGAHLVVVRGLSTKKFQPECVNEERSTERWSSVGPTDLLDHNVKI